ncbi:hypothetical protein DB347_11525 [Opitutaceae bacterium EW11]|nr:hypothetical protein DB347_11525 [Opitutaceae bacterium EW11]
MNLLRLPSILSLALRFGVLAVWAGCALLRAQRIDVISPDVQPVVVESAAVSTEVTGRIAVTTFDLVFRNPNSRVLEGTFLFPLLDGQQVIRFALDVDGSMRDAVPVERTHARVVFEEIERRGVDPALLEQAAGNVYRARVYPIPAQGTRHLLLSYQESLPPASDQITYRLNLNFAQPLKLFRLSLNVHTGATLPAQARTTLDLQLPPWRDGQFMEVERSDFDARGLFEIVLPKAERPRVMTGRFNGKEYFYAEVPNTPLLFSRPAPKVLGLIWDCSTSGSGRDHLREFALLDAWFGELKNLEVHLVRLRDHVARPETFSVRNGDWQALKRELESTVYDGATSLEGLADDARVDTWMIVSDGLLNYGAAESSKKLPLHGPVHAIVAAAKSDTHWLRAAAARSGGEYINLLETTAAKGSFALQTQSMRILGIDSDAQAVTHVFPEPGAPIDGDSFAVAGRLRKREAVIRIRVGQNRENSQTLEVQLVSGDNPSILAPRAWALQKIESLAADADANRADIQETSREFGIVTSETTLMVLESVADYIRYGIAPPDSLRSEWEARRATDATMLKANRDHHLQQVIQTFERRVAWWEKRYPKDTPPDRRKFGETESQQPTPQNDQEPPEVALEALDNSPTVGSLGAASPTPSSALRTRFVSAGTAAASNTGEDSGSSTIALKAWSPSAGYLDHLRRVSPDKRYAAYLEERVDHERSPGFFLDAADFFFEAGDTELALRILSNLAELEVDDAALLRVLGNRLVQANRPDLAIPEFERVARLRPEEPQSLRDLALACAAAGRNQRAIDLLADVVNQSWDPRFPEIEQIAISEINAIAATSSEPLDLSRIDPRLRKNLPLDVRAVLTWDANDCDIDLWVTDPNGETAKYDFPLTHQGGMLSRDFTGGYGPEEFLLRQAKPGGYRVRINYYGDRRQTALGPVTAQVRLITGFGTPNQQEKRLTVRLKSRQETLDIGNVDIGGALKKGK